MRMTFVTIVCAILLTVAAINRATASGVPPDSPALTSNAIGRNTFAQFCAPCHGPSGRGNGPVAFYLPSRPRDLTTLAATHHGFPGKELTARLLSSQPQAFQEHMPSWGAVFASLERDPAAALTRVEALVAYIEELQR